MPKLHSWGLIVPTNSLPKYLLIQIKVIKQSKNISSQEDFQNIYLSNCFFHVNIWNQTKMLIKLSRFLSRFYPDAIWIKSG